MTKTIPTEIHPLESFLPENAKILMLGSFPPPRERWSMDFYYPNIQNDMWRIFGRIYFDDPEHFVKKGGFDKERIEAFCAEKGIALSDAAHAIKRLKDNASDDQLEIVEAVDLQALLTRLPNCRTVVTTGGKSTEVICRITGAIEPEVGLSTNFSYAGRQMRLYRMPSSSRAYPRTIDQKAIIYAGMLRMCGLL